jgi:hypothetical protein
VSLQDDPAGALPLAPTPMIIILGSLVIAYSRLTAE